MPDIELGDRRTEQVRNKVQIAEHGLPQLLGSADFVASTVECEAPAERVVGLSDIVIELLLEHPELMQRPILVAGDRALICRPPERALELL